MNDKTKHYMEIMEQLGKMAFAAEPPDDWEFGTAVPQMIRELRQFIERLRRLNEADGEVPLPLAVKDVPKLSRDELAFLVKKFYTWYNENECPRHRCKDYFCRHCRNRKDDADEELANGEISAEDYNIQAENCFDDEMCESDQEGCWADYYLWCYRNGVDPDTGRKKS